VTLRTFDGCAAVLLLANTVYIAAAASATVFYMGSVLARVVVGATVWIAALALIVRDRAFRGSWRARIAVTALTIAGVIAAEIVRRGNLLELRWVLMAHIAAGAIATAALVPLAWRLAASSAAGASVKCAIKRCDAIEMRAQHLNSGQFAGRDLADDHCCGTRSARVA
jgi:hypothetical protein